MEGRPVATAFHGRGRDRPDRACGTTLYSARAILHVQSDAVFEMLKESFI